MHLLDVMNLNYDTWEEKLSKAPYSLKIVHEGPYVLLKYQPFISEMEYAICQEARGAIFRDMQNHYIPISIALYKFFNAAEKYAVTEFIDWSTATVSEKVDGSLMKLGYDPVDKCWLLSSNGSIFARNVEAGDTNFEDLFISILGGKNKYNELLSILNTDYCYFFEMVSPQNRICVKYNKPAIYFLGRRNMRTMEEDNEQLEFDTIQHVKQYDLFSLSDCISAAAKYQDNFEGFVVRDASFRRIKIKTPWYIGMHKLRGDSITVKRVIEMWKTDVLDDFIAAFPEYNDFIQSVMHPLSRLISVADMDYMIVSRYENVQSRADFAEQAKQYVAPIRSYLFARLDKKFTNATDFFKQYNTNNLRSYINEYVKEQEIGVKEDE